jgi:hypothetical protein
LRKQGFDCTLLNGEVIINNLNFKKMTKAISVGHILTRDAMKNLKGGKVYAVNCNIGNGYHQEAPGSCSGTQSQCQAAANSWCSSHSNYCSSCSLSAA